MHPQNQGKSFYKYMRLFVTIIIIYFKYCLENQGKKTIVFDLDETLIHCNESTDIPADVIVPIKFPNNETVDVIIHSDHCVYSYAKTYFLLHQK